MGGEINSYLLKILFDLIYALLDPFGLLESFFSAAWLKALGIFPAPAV
jgi:hypothetical protein